MSRSSGSPTGMVLAVILPLLFVQAAVAADPDLVAMYLADLKAGPTLYYTPEAAASVAAAGGPALAGLSTVREAAKRAFRAAARLGGLPRDAVKDAVPILIDIFPRVVHVIEIPALSYTGKGLFEDCVSTYVMSAKNQFMLTNPVLEYDAMSACEEFIEAPYETEIIEKKTKRNGVIAQATFNLKITFTFYVGECALSRITGMDFGHDPSAWRQWHRGSKNQSAKVTPSSVGEDIVVGGKYRVMLVTGDDLIGRVESKDDTSMIIETEGGKPYTFRYTLMSSYVALELPPPPDTVSADPAVPEAAPAAPASIGPLDTVWVRNPETDAYGRPKKDIMYVGVINKESDAAVEMEAFPGNVPVTFSRAMITRVIRSSAPVDDALARYAKPLSCPSDMVLVDMPAGRGDKPFFKVCVDKYEFPNKAGAVPRTAVSFAEAKALCEKQGKRLCTSQEWMAACGGVSEHTYPYGKTLEQNRCNSDLRLVEASGSRINCRSPFGGYDMVGNIFEWVVTEEGKSALMGGPLSKCQTVSPSASGDARPQLGLRCCKGN